jgi:hypothetical protein
LRLLLNFILLVWSSIANLVARYKTYDPRARLNAGGKWREQAVATGMDVFEAGVTGVGAGGAIAAGGGNASDAFNPSAMYNNTVNPATMSLGQQAGSLGAKGGTQAGLIGGVVFNAKIGDMAYAGGGDHRMKRNEGTTQAPPMPDQQDATAKAKDAVQGVGDIGNQSQGIIGKLQEGLAQGESQAKGKNKKEDSTVMKALKGIAEVLLTITVLPGIMWDIGSGADKGLQEHEQEQAKLGKG